MSVFGFDRRDVRPVVNFLLINIRDRYLGSRLGIFWAIANPLLMMLIYTFVFVYVFKARLPGADSTLAYTIWLISGYGPWLAISEGVIGASNSVVAASGLVKNLAFKTEILPVVGALLGVVPLAVTLSFMMILLVADGNLPTWHALLIFPLIVLQFFFIASVGFFLSALNVFLRDLSLILPNVLTMILFLSPVFYPPETLPVPFRRVMAVNPLYIICEGFRNSLVDHKLPDLKGWLFLFILSALLTYAGLFVFRRLKGHFEAAL